MNATECINFLRGLYKRGEVVSYKGTPVIFCDIGFDLTAEVFFENGNIWCKPLKDITKFEGNVKADRFTRGLKLKFYGVRNWRCNFEKFL